MSMRGQVVDSSHAGRAPRCRCADPLVFADEPDYCFRCGRGELRVPQTGRSPRPRRLPWDLGALQREGRRPDLSLDNVVRLDRLRMVPRLIAVPEPKPARVSLPPQPCKCGCGLMVEPTSGGRPREYASRKCINRAYHERHKGQAAA